MRRTMLYLPGNNPNMLLKGYLFAPDGIILDLEDSVPLGEKVSARVLVREAIRGWEFGGCEVTVRINGLDTPYVQYDLEEIVPLGISGIRVPKVEDPAEVADLDRTMSKLEAQAGLQVGSTKIFCLLETARGVLRAFDIATASSRVAAIIPGGEDLAADLKTSRSKEGTELEWARRYVVMAARAAGVDPLDTVYPDVNDPEGLEWEVRFIRQLGFEGKSVIHPNQIGVIHRVFTPSKEEVLRARRIVEAAREAEAKGLGAVALDGRMIDAPVVKRAIRTLELAEAMGGGDRHDG
ncbi:HpcH/HpaI aldolase/citrate lyase family protein [Thermanaerovibrio acidaminovorans]|uniref:HpcH/HpaI aldolase/citrate lyase family protein n=1 Tax=Thermanaerovibrio acidaminovorans TaxID=81462 RepID=UPI0024919F6E|nr:aldolase/citrate lyase family protein [Thermanaerovibrio acidaminovorans]